MSDAAELVENYTNHAHSDHVGLWQIVSRLQDEMVSADPKALRSKSLEIARGLILNGICPGDYISGGFTFWSGTVDDKVKRIESEWKALGQAPDLAHSICWFASRPA